MQIRDWIETQSHHTYVVSTKELGDSLPHLASSHPPGFSSVVVGSFSGRVFGLLGGLCLETLINLTAECASATGGDAVSLLIIGDGDVFVCDKGR